MQQHIYRSVFWIGYIFVLLTTFIPIAGALNRIKIGPEAFHIRLDHLLHLLVYFLICMYFLFGIMKGFKLFRGNSFYKFIFVTIFLGIVTEGVQLWVPERAFNVFDMVANVSGIIIGVAVIRMVQGRESMMS